ncbi:uncharacterized protein [Aristolochia californica]|uniref:uncharacterized protein n=1 Tax=Aristolochia californica TaxID=171875 RepID=UPI0035DB2994
MRLAAILQIFTPGMYVAGLLQRVRTSKPTNPVEKIGALNHFCSICVLRLAPIVVTCLRNLFEEKTTRFPPDTYRTCLKKSRLFLTFLSTTFPDFTSSQSARLGLYTQFAFFSNSKVVWRKDRYLDNAFENDKQWRFCASVVKEALASLVTSSRSGTRRKELRDEEESQLTGIRVRPSYSVNLPPGFFLKKGVRESVRDWMELPHISPYTDVDQASPEVEKRSVVVLHESLCLSFLKRMVTGLAWSRAEPEPAYVRVELRT